MTSLVFAFFAENSSKWLERKAVEQQMGSLNDEIENLKADKKKLRALVDDGQAQIKTKDEEITNLEREVKSLLQVTRPLLSNSLSSRTRYRA